MTKLVPKLRFKEFSGEWEEKKLGDIIEYFKGFAFKSQEYSASGRRIIRVSDMGFDYIKSNEAKTYISEEDAKKYDKWKLREDDLIVTTVGSKPPIYDSLVGRSIVVKLKDKDSLLNQNAVCLRANEEIKQSFLNILFKKESYIKYIETIIRGNANQGSIALKDLFEYLISLPKDPKEQQKIASTLSSLDNLIEATKQKVEALQKHKKGLMQQLFPTDGEKVPKLRFKEFSGEWEEKKLGDLLHYYKLGGNYKSNKTKNYFPLIKMGNLGRGNINLNTLEYIKNSTDINKNDLLEYGDLLFNTRNTLDLVGKVSIWKNELPEAYYNSNLMKMTYDNNFFMNYLFNTEFGLSQIRSIATGTTSVAAIYTKDLININFLIPTPKEQQKIASILSSLDNLIEAYKQKVEALQKHKKGLMQQMFVSNDDIKKGQS